METSSPIVLPAPLAQNYRFPFEIWSDIFEYCDTDTLYNVSFVSRWLKDIAQDHMLKGIVLCTPYRPRPHNGIHLPALIELLNNVPRTHHRLQKLTIGAIWGMSEECVDQIHKLPHLPMLNSLVLEQIFTTTANRLWEILPPMHSLRHLTLKHFGSMKVVYSLSEYYSAMAQLPNLESLELDQISTKLFQVPPKEMVPRFQLRSFSLKNCILSIQWIQWMFSHSRHSLRTLAIYGPWFHGNEGFKALDYLFEMVGDELRSLKLASISSEFITEKALEGYFPTLEFLVIVAVIDRPKFFDTLPKSLRILRLSFSWGLKDILLTGGLPKLQDLGILHPSREIVETCDKRNIICRHVDLSASVV